MKKNEIAVTDGHDFAIIPHEEMEGIALQKAGAVRYAGENRELFKAPESDSRKVETLLNRYGKLPVPDYAINPVIMRGEIHMEIPGFDASRDNLLFGGYSFVCNGVRIPVDFSGIAWDIQQEGDQLTVPFVTGKTPLATDYFLDDCYEADYASAGLKIQDVTAEYLSRASAISEFVVSLELGGIEYAVEDIARMGRFAINALCFEDGEKAFSVERHVIAEFNGNLLREAKRPLSEQIQAAGAQAAKTQCGSEREENSLESER